MVSNNKGSKPIVWSNFRLLSSREEINSFIKGLELYIKYELDCDETRLDTKLIISYINDIKNAYSRLNSSQCRAEFRSAHKRRTESVRHIIEKVLYESKLSQSVNVEIKKEHTNFIIRVNGDLCDIVSIHPRSFSKLFTLCKQLLESNKSSAELLVYSRVLSSICDLHNDYVLSDQESDEQILSELDIITNPENMIISESDIRDNLTNPESLQSQIITTIKLLKEFVIDNTSLRLIPKWAISFVRALKRMKVVSFNNLDLKERTSSSGTSIIQKSCKSKTVPAVLATLYEPDKYKDLPIIHQFDLVTGFNYSYNEGDVDLRQKTKSRFRSSSVIQQKKPKDRLIHLADNPTQDRLLFFYEISRELQYHLYEDCTHDQRKGPEFIRESFKDSSKAIYSLDLTSATNTMSMEMQAQVKAEILKLMYPTDVVDDVLIPTWKFFMSHPTQLKLRGGKTLSVSLASGQPMGLLDSFNSFAILHHIVMLTIMRIYYPDQDSRSFYRILGDDLVVSLADSGMHFPDLYIKYISAVNVECNKTKGYLYNPGHEGYQSPIAEFAKYLYIDGYDITAIPTKLLLVSTTQDAIALLSWVEEHSSTSRKNPYYLMEFLRNYGFMTSQDIKSWEPLLFYQTETLVNTIFPHYRLDDDLFSKIDLIYLLGQFKDTMLFGILNRYLSEGSILKGIDASFSVRGLGNIMDDFLSSMQSPRYKDKPLYRLYLILEDIQLQYEYLFDYLFKDNSQNLSENDLLIASLPIFRDLSDQGVDVYCIRDFMRLLHQEILISELEQTDILYYCKQLVTLMRTNFSYHERTWSGYNKRIFLRRPFESLFEFYEEFKSLFSSNGFDTLDEFLTTISDRNSSLLPIRDTINISKRIQDKSYPIDLDDTVDVAQDIYDYLLDLADF